MLAPRQAIVVVVALVVLGETWWVVAGRPRAPGIAVGFWFEPVTFDSEWLGGALTSVDLAAIESAARAEIAEAFRGYPLRLSDRRDARYLRPTRRRGEKVAEGRMRGSFSRGQGALTRPFGPPSPARGEG